MRKVEVTEARLLDGSTEYVAGDVKTLPDDKAALWISLGWAKCVETGETGERKPGAAAPISPESISQDL